jgi:hypothetical protein
MSCWVASHCSETLRRVSPCAPAPVQDADGHGMGNNAAVPRTHQGETCKGVMSRRQNLTVRCYRTVPASAAEAPSFTPILVVDIVARTINLRSVGGIRQSPSIFNKSGYAYLCRSSAVTLVAAVAVREAISSLPVGQVARKSKDRRVKVIDSTTGPREGRICTFQTNT